MVHERGMRLRFPLLFLGALVSMAGLSGCETPGQSAVAGAAAGALVGGSIKGSGNDMARGAAIGAAGGYLLGKAAEADRNRVGSGYGGAYYPAPHSHSHVPWGRSSGRYGFVYSPYSNRLIDVRRVPRGAEVVDPFTGRVFRNP